MRFLAKKKHARTLWLLLFAVVMGAGWSIVSSYLFIFLRTDLDAPQLLLGLTISGMVVVEIPVFRGSGWLHKTFSDSSLLLIGMASWSFRLAAYSFLPNALHGLTFGCSWLAAVHALSSTFPEELNASAFGLLHSSVNGVGTIIGTVVGGYGYQYLGARAFFRVCAVTMAVLALVFRTVDARLASITVASADCKKEVDMDKISASVA